MVAHVTHTLPTWKAAVAFSVTLSCIQTFKSPPGWLSQYGPTRSLPTRSPTLRVLDPLWWYTHTHTHTYLESCCGLQRHPVVHPDIQESPWLTLLVQTYQVTTDTPPHPQGTRPLVVVHTHTHLPGKLLWPSVSPCRASRHSRVPLADSPSTDPPGHYRHAPPPSGY